MKAISSTNHFILPLRYASPADERGFSLILFALLISIIVGFSALIIDHGKEEIAVQNLQRAADAAALGAARRLNGRVDGWWDSKKAAVASLKRNPIHGASQSDLANISLNEPTSDAELGENKAYRAFWDRQENLALLKHAPDPHNTIPAFNPTNKGNSGGFHVKVERGLYWAVSENQYTFKSLESDDNGMAGAVPYYIVANAVKVTVSLDKLDTIFGGVFGVSNFANLSRESIAIMDTNLQRTVLPIGIPICQLLFNADPYDNNSDHLSDDYNPVRQCERPMYVTELDAKGDVGEDLGVFGSTGSTGSTGGTVNTGSGGFHGHSGGSSGSGGASATTASALMSIDERRDGLTRAESFERPAYYWQSYNGRSNMCYADFAGNAHNCKSLPLYATLGLPTTAPHQSAEADDIRTVMTRPGVSAQVGQYFKPLRTLNGLTDDGARQAFADGIKLGGLKGDTVSKVFMNNGNIPSINFPFLRTQRVHDDPQGRPPIHGDDAQDKKVYDQNISMPSGDGDVIKFMMMDRSLSGGRSQLNFTNPMCHDANLRHDDPSAPVLQQYAMVIAPDKEFSEGELVRYCDFERVFQSTTQRAVTPAPETEPVVVGFVKVDVFDFNFQRLATRTDPLGTDIGRPNYSTATGNGGIWDNNPAALNLYGNRFFKDFISKGNQYSQEYDKCDKLDDDGTVIGKAKKDECENKLPEVPEVPDVTTELDRCFKLDGLRALVVALKHASNPFSKYDAIHKLNDILERPIPAKDNIHCLPRLKDGLFNRNSLDSYMPLHDLDSGVGCGGLRAKIDDCEEHDLSIPTGQDWNKNSPALVTSSDLP